MWLHSKCHICWTTFICLYATDILIYINYLYLCTTLILIDVQSLVTCSQLPKWLEMIQLLVFVCNIWVVFSCFLGNHNNMKASPAAAAEAPRSMAIFELLDYIVNEVCDP